MERIEGENLRIQLFRNINDVIKKREVGIPEMVDHLLGFEAVKFTESDKPAYVNLTPFADRFRRLPGILFFYVEQLNFFITLF